MFQTANHIEASLWIVVGLIFAGASAVRRQPQRRLCLMAAAAFCLFGVTDIIEAKTGAWWEPWWLLVLKGTCIAALLMLLTAYLKQRRNRG